MSTFARADFEVLQVSNETVILRIPERSPRPPAIAMERIDPSARPLIELGAILSTIIGLSVRPAFKDIL
ncbi:hypothetical protein SLNSH_01895 [Alsobacter soli]|uniref:Uncharacterized protein n=1 Tax=Alsobacter soli TaxID=2109933 RepID=A0A2T1HYC7_9HYPH|nr:hypothetical protein SLNSH_01895 [Alsobacter soli]